MMVAMASETIVAEPFDGPVAARMIAAVQQEYVRRYGGEDASPTGPGEFGPPGGTFLVVYRDGTAVACGGLRRLDDETCELKRMYVIDGARRSGVGRRLLAALEAAAIQLGYRVVKLETGNAQPEALGLYTSAGYEPIDNFGYYRCAPLSRSFAKVLTPAL